MDRVNNFVGTSKEKLSTYTEAETQELHEKKMEKIDSRLSSAQQVYDKYKDEESFQVEGSLANDYLIALDARIEKLKAKQIKVQEKKTGLFRMSMVALKKVTNEKIDKVQKKRAERKAQKQKEKEAEKENLLKTKGTLELFQKFADVQKQYNELRGQLTQLAESQGMTMEELFASINPSREEETAKKR